MKPSKKKKRKIKKKERKNIFQSYIFHYYILKHSLPKIKLYKTKGTVKSNIEPTAYSVLLKLCIVKQNLINATHFLLKKGTHIYTIYKFCVTFMEGFPEVQAKNSL